MMSVGEKPPATLVQETILVVEDEVFVRMTIAEYLRHCGFKVIEAANADEAMVVLQNAEIRVDVVFSDIEMPGSMDGFALSRWVREERPDVDVILAGSVKRAVTAATELCDEGPLPKPYESQLVTDRIRRLIAARAAKKKSDTSKS
jgi:DNA-binding NtrC family response regulator